MSSKYLQKLAKESFLSKTNDEISTIAQEITEQILELKSQLKEFTTELNFGIDDNENEILNKVYSTLQDKRNQELQFIAEQVPEIVKTLASTISADNMDVILHNINEIKLLNEQRKFFELYSLLSEINVPVSIKKRNKNSNVPNESGTRTPGGTLRVYRPDGSTLEYPKSTTTFCQAIIEIGVQKIYDLKIEQEGSFLVFKDSDPQPNQGSYHDIGDGFFVNTHSNTQTKLKRLQQIIQSLNLDWRVELV